ncbi:hypothetical protein LEP1GSC185_0080 [Leptospira licerasiae serovar Varillal str. VAR 010]|uniref:Uncharacterized protein n=1 Tax=Leptospira licerasiae str. MMD4847 TaxID=1049971 RepID=A0ABN0HAG8_9LEPT|nr:hypothetical protein LEP1GSC185_0080 [Leptospira licerasiae serovar Varillal str. VAR 010]EJZ42574.1 hypothetical protein LEP1GSC178_2439 [Leptospira licerasiae str. MMD4847]
MIHSDRLGETVFKGRVNFNFMRPFFYFLNFLSSYFLLK